jgi:adenylate cyclase
MAKEIERKFLVKSTDYRLLAEAVKYLQGYICNTPDKVVRIRIAGDKAFITIKGASKGDTREEFEYEILSDDARQMLDKLCEKPLIEKTRRIIPFGGKTWVVDEFEGENEGLILAEIELLFSAEPVEIPAWIADEVTGDTRYYNSNLVQNPYKGWNKH